LLSPFNLKYYLVDESILISYDINPEYSLVRYDLRDLIKNLNLKKGNKKILISDFPLLLKSWLAPSLWTKDTTINSDSKSNLLIIQTKQMHIIIEQFLMKLRRHKEASKFEKINAFLNENKIKKDLVMQLYPVNDLINVMKPELIKKYIIKNIDSQIWSDVKGNSIEIYKNKIVAVCEMEVQHKIVKFLSNLRKLLDKTLKNKTMKENKNSSNQIIDAKILATMIDKNMVMLSVGKRDSVKVGYHFKIYRDKEYIGKVKISEVYENMSAAKVIDNLNNGKGLKIEKGDMASNRP